MGNLVMSSHIAGNDRGITSIIRPQNRQFFIMFDGPAVAGAMDPTKFFNETRLIDRNLLMIRDCRRTWFLDEIEPGIPDAPALVAYLKKS